MKRIGYISAGVVLGTIVALTLPSLAQDTGSPVPSTADRTVTVNGTATIKAKPDEAVVGLGVQTQANTAQGALSENATKMTALIAALMDKGIAKDDIATSYVSIYPTYGNNGMDITGYQAVEPGRRHGSRHLQGRRGHRRRRQGRARTCRTASRSSCPTRTRA